MAKNKRNYGDTRAWISLRRAIIDRLKEWSSFPRRPIVAVAQLIYLNSFSTSDIYICIIRREYLKACLEVVYS